MDCDIGEFMGNNSLIATVLGISAIAFVLSLFSIRALLILIVVLLCVLISPIRLQNETPFDDDEPIYERAPTPVPEIPTQN